MFSAPARTAGGDQGAAMLGPRPLSGVGSPQVAPTCRGPRAAQDIVSLTWELLETAQLPPQTFRLREIPGTPTRSEA